MNVKDIIIGGVYTAETLYAPQSNRTVIDIGPQHRPSDDKEEDGVQFTDVGNIPKTMFLETFAKQAGDRI